MFGRRSDGYLIKKIDPIVAMMPHIMAQRNDAMVQLEYEIDYGKLARYVVKKEQETGIKLRFMDVVIAAFVRTIAELPELNRFIINKRIYARNTLSVSFAVLRSNGENVSDVDENTTKCYFDPHDTIYQVSDRITKTIDEARKPDADNATMKVASTLLTPQQNAAKYYKRYNKAKSAEVHLREQIAIAESERAYLESVLQEIAQAESEQEFEEIRRELRQTGYLRRGREKKDLI